jgi:hypothetical protein
MPRRRAGATWTAAPSKDLTRFFQLPRRSNNLVGRFYQRQRTAARNAGQALIWVVFIPPKMVAWPDVPRKWG